MHEASTPITVAVHHDSWLRHQIRDMVLHLDAPVETAELLQVGLISLSQALMQFEWESAGQAPKAARESAWLSAARERVKADLMDEVRQMTHLSRMQRRRWVLVKLAREHLHTRLKVQGISREPTSEEIAAVTGLSVHEVDVLHRMARLEPWEPDRGSLQVLEMRSLKPPAEEELRQAREDTHVVLEQLAPVLLLCPAERLRLLQEHFGVSCWVDGKPLVPAEAPASTSWLSRWIRKLAGTRQVRRPHIEPRSIPVKEEVWPSRLNVVLKPGDPGTSSDRTS